MPHRDVSSSTDADEWTTRQRRLAYEVSGEEDAAAILFPDLPAGITVGRHGSRLQVRVSDADVKARGWAVRFVPRGGGAMLHVPGQVACYPILPLNRLDITPGEYVRRLVRLTADLAAGYDLPAEADEHDVAVRVNGRRVAHVGVSVRNGVSLFGLVLNVHPDLEAFRDVRVDGDPLPMTSLQGVSAARISPGEVRWQLADRIADEFGFARTPPPRHRPPTLIHLTRRHALALRH